MGVLLRLAVVALSAVIISSAVGAECQCRYQGKQFKQGQVVCIRVDGTAKLARCGMNLNNSSWVFVKTACPTALPTPPTMSVVARLPSAK